MAWSPPIATGRAPRAITFSIRAVVLAKLLHQIVAAGLRIVVAGATGGEAQRMLAQRPRAEARAAHEGRALVGRHAQDRDHGVELRDVRADGRAQEGGDADEGELEADVGGGIFGWIG